MKINEKDFEVKTNDRKGAVYSYTITKKTTSSSVLIGFPLALHREKNNVKECKNLEELEESKNVKESKEFKEFREAVFNQAYSYLYTHEGEFEAIFRPNSSPEDFENIVEKSE